MRLSAIVLVSCLPVLTAAFGVVTRQQSTRHNGVALRMGLFDGVKDAFSAPALERSAIDSERETPIDRWMGWSVVSENDKVQKAVAGT